MYSASSYASKDYRAWLSRRINPLIDSYGLRASADDDYPKTSRSAGKSAQEPYHRSERAARSAALVAPSQQALF